MGVASVEHYFNSEKARPSLLVNDNPKIGISNTVVSANEGYLICSFSRAKTYSNIDNYFDLNDDYYSHSYFHFLPKMILVDVNKL